MTDRPLYTEVRVRHPNLVLLGRALVWRWDWLVDRLLDWIEPPRDPGPGEPLRLVHDSERRRAS